MSLNSTIELKDHINSAIERLSETAQRALSEYNYHVYCYDRLSKEPDFYKKIVVDYIDIESAMDRAEIVVNERIKLAEKAYCDYTLVINLLKGFLRLVESTESFDINTDSNGTNTIIATNLKGLVMDLLEKYPNIDEVTNLKDM